MRNTRTQTRVGATGHRRAHHCHKTHIPQAQEHKTSKRYPTHACTNNRRYGKIARVVARRRQRNKVCMYESAQTGPPPKGTQANPHTNAPTNQVTATRTIFPLNRPSTPRKEIWYAMTHAHQREEGTARHQRPQRSHNEPQNTRRARGNQQRGTKHGMRGAHTPERTLPPQNTHTTNPGTRRTGGRPGARCPHARKSEQHTVWLKARTRHSNVLVLVSKPSRSTSLPKSTLCRSPTPWMCYGQMGKL